MANSLRDLMDYIQETCEVLDSHHGNVDAGDSENEEEIENAMRQWALGLFCFLALRLKLIQRFAKIHFNIPYWCKDMLRNVCTLTHVNQASGSRDHNYN